LRYKKSSRPKYRILPLPELYLNACFKTVDEGVCEDRKGSAALIDGIPAIMAAAHIMYFIVIVPCSVLAYWQHNKFKRLMLSKQTF
jgi:hypothetical protein